MTYTQLLHGFFNFLGTTEGELLKTTIELIFFAVVDYMIISEWTRNKKRELKFLIIAFSTLAISKAVSVYFIANVVFTNAQTHFWTLNTAENFFEIFALFLVANAFIYPILRQKRIKTKKFMADHFLLLLAVSFVFSIFALSIIDLMGGSLENFWTNTSINVAEVVVLLYYAGYLLVNPKQHLRYRANIFTAFVVYTITPVINLFNIILYDNTSRSLNVAATPFPFIAIMLFTQVIYLKLVDKATLQDRLKKSEQLYAQEKEISRMKDDFISTVSHELKTPLTSMKLYVGLMKAGRLGKMNKKQTESLCVVNEETDRLNKLITDLLEISRLKAHKSKLELEEFDLRDVVHDRLSIDLARKQHSIRVAIDVPKGFVITADRHKMKQVFINLFNNAMKFTPEKGKITVSAKKLDTEWEMTVADTGVGIERDKIPKLFEKFYQTEDYMTRTKGGFGLGLAIVKGVVDLHKGKIFVDSELAKGTAITIRIPNISRY
ncbi:sensor histidine kinase [Nanoarchaeota archaeon]